jgi:hypothetical protein
MSSGQLHAGLRRGRLPDQAVFVVAAWRSISRLEWLTALAIGVFWSAANYLIESQALFRPRTLPLDDALHTAAFIVATCIFGLLGWVLVDRADPGQAGAGGLRIRRIAIVLVTASVLGWIVLPHLFNAVPSKRPEVSQSEKRPDERRRPRWLLQMRSTIESMVFGGLAFGLVEAHRRRRRETEALQSVQRKREQLERRALEARLATMQAQVEPQFLFDSVVDVQATYERDLAAGAQAMDRLINYLRVALPRLREQGSTVQAEVELLAAFLGVVALRHDGRPKVKFLVPPDAADARFYPMLLLPLVQRAMRISQRDRGRVPECVELVAKRHGEELGLLLRIDAGGLCADDPEFARVRERLAGLYADRAHLVCREPQAGSTEFVLRVPL